MVSKRIAVLDNVGDGIVAPNAAWSFGGKTAAAFAEHVRRSIPMYDEGHRLVCKISDFFVRDDSRVYELGLSLGELLGRLVEHHGSRSSVQWIGIDNEEGMTAQAHRSLSVYDNVTVETADVSLYEFLPTDLIVSYYCLQFVPPKRRQTVVDRIYDALEWGGGFIWFEKVRGPDARFQDILSLLYTDYKLEQKYGADEIIAKSRSLKAVLEPFSSEGNRGILERAGFVDVVTVFRYLCFEGVLAIK